MKTKTMKLFFYLLLIIQLLVVTACSNQTEESSGDGKTNSEESNDLTIAISQDVDTFDTHNTTAVSTESVMVNLQSYLIKRDNESKLHPHLLESYELKDDLTWSFVLKENIKFHNGDPLTAEDVKFSLERVATDNTLKQYQNYKTIKEVKIIDDTHFDIVTDGPDPVLPYRLAREAAGIFPKKYIEENGWEEFLKHPIGSGPYEFVEWNKGESLVMKKFNDYFGGDVSDWDTITFRTIIETSTRIGEVLTGGVQIANSIPPTDWDRVNSNDRTEVINGDQTSVMMLMVNQNKEFKTSDSKVREAIDYAIDNQALIDKYTPGSVATRTRVVPGVAGFEESLYDTNRYDPEKAIQLLEEAGYIDSNPLEITYTASQGRTYADSEQAQMITGMLEAVGIKVNLKLLEASQYVDVRTTGKNEELLQTSWNNTLFDPSLALIHFHSTYNSEGFGYNNPVVDDLLDKAAVNMNPEERAKQYQEVQKIVSEELPYIYIYVLKDFYAVSDSVQFEPRVDGMFYVEEIKKK
ncbi:ABC transporter substrate-binding protein [Bacillus sp. J37]|uniref:ABC transporter substrate-binding protein n=1 Tax=Bacillus sp. J37 TaxID=935837 RepID=UPI00047E5C43|nr:ABC transporter substrate-binding protein [Bacillus sp. J37]